MTFTFETVMSSRDKVDLLCKAQQLGYRTYLYYVATEDPIINISRVKARVRRGGHWVPEDKIVSRYSASLDLLLRFIGAPIAPTCSTTQTISRSLSLRSRIRKY